jgi:hypothetical protein
VLGEKGKELVRRAVVAEPGGVHVEGLEHAFVEPLADAHPLARLVDVEIEDAERLALVDRPALAILWVGKWSQCGPKMEWRSGGVGEWGRRDEWGVGRGGVRNGREGEQRRGNV